MQHLRKNDYNHVKLGIAIALSGVAAILSLINLFFGGVSKADITDALIQMETLKAWGEENRDKLHSLYTNPKFQSQQSQNIDAALTSMGGTPDNANNNTAQQPATSNTLTNEQITSLLDNAAIDGNKDSDILVIEYSDFECPFCQKHFENGTIESLIKNSKIGSIFKQFPLNFHPLAQKAAEGNICVREALGDEKYFEYINDVFASKDPSLANITAIAVKLGMKETAFKSCLDSNKFAGQVTSETNEWQQLFGVNWTPGNVIINKKTGKFVVVSWAQPLSAFEQAITQIK